MGLALRFSTPFGEAVALLNLKGELLSSHGHPAAQAGRVFPPLVAL